MKSDSAHEWICIGCSAEGLTTPDLQLWPDEPRSLATCRGTPSWKESVTAKPAAGARSLRSRRQARKVPTGALESGIVQTIVLQGFGSKRVPQVSGHEANASAPKPEDGLIKLAGPEVLLLDFLF